MQISNLVSQYNNSVANGEPMTGAKGVEKLVSSLNEMSKGMIFEGTVSSVRGNQVKLALSNGQQILARLAGKFSFEQVRTDVPASVQVAALVTVHAPKMCLPQATSVMSYRLFCLLAKR